MAREGKGRGEKTQQQRGEARSVTTQFSEEKLRCLDKGVDHRTKLCAHTPWYLAPGTSSTALEAVRAGSTLGVLHVPP